MRKQTDDELGKLLPDTLLSVIEDKTYTDEFVGKLVRGILWNSISTYGNDAVLKALHTALYPHYNMANKRRMDRINAIRDSKKKYQRSVREDHKAILEAGRSVLNGIPLVSIGGNGSKGKGREVKERKDNTPVVPCGDQQQHEPPSILERDIGVICEKKACAVPEGWTVEKLISLGQTVFSPVIPEEFVRMFWQRMEERGWRTDRGSRVTAYTIRGVLSKWWASEQKYASEKKAAADLDDTPVRDRDPDCRIVII